MILLMIHSSFFSYEVREKAISSAEENPINEFKGENVLVIFISIEEGDDSNLALKAMEYIMEDVEKVKPSMVVLYPYAHLSNKLAKPSVAVSLMKEIENSLSEKIKVIRAPFGWYKTFTISCYGHPLSELSRRIGKEEDNPVHLMKQSEEIKYCEKFGFPSSPHATFMRNAVLEWVKSKARDMVVETVGNTKPSQGEFSVNYFEAKGKIIPCLNENPNIIAIYGGVMDMDVPYSFHDSANKVDVSFNEGGVTKINVNALTYYFMIQSVKDKVYPTLPMWMSPIQVRILPVKRDFIDDAIRIAGELESRDVRVDIDDLNDGLGNKIRRAGKEWIPLVGILGERERKTSSLTVKIREETEQKSLTVEEIASIVMSADQLKLKRKLPILLSRRPKFEYL
jgi:threonyl-tRNA synthetase